jgi:HNH endonuclease
MRKRKIYDRDWARLRIRFLRAHPVCSLAGCTERATEVDHIESVRSAPHRRLDWFNLQALCKSHHSSLTGLYDRGGPPPFSACDVNGNPTDPRHPWFAESNEAAVATMNNPRPALSKDVARHKRASVLGVARKKVE